MADTPDKVKLLFNAILPALPVASFPDNKTVIFSEMLPTLVLAWFPDSDVDMLSDTSPTLPVAELPDSATVLVVFTLPGEPVARLPVTGNVSHSAESQVPVSHAPIIYAIRSKPVLASFVGMDNTNVPAVTVCEPNVCTLIALLLWGEL